MNIDKDALYEKALAAWRGPGNTQLSTRRVVDAVLAEVAKHDTPDKPAYYKTSKRLPKKGDADEGGYVLAWCIGNPKRIRWSDAQWDVDVRDFPDIYPFWTLMPPKPFSEDDAAFEAACATFMHESQRGNAKKLWDAALAHRDKSKP